MRDIFYAIYRGASGTMLLDVLLAESVLRGWAAASGSKVRVAPGAHLSHEERQVLERIRFGKQSRLEEEHVLALKGYYRRLFRRRRYTFRLPIFGIVTRRRFRSEVRKTLRAEGFDNHIVDYVESGDRSRLKPIVAHIDDVRYPSFVGKTKRGVGPYRDIVEMMDEGRRQSLGLFR